MADVTKIDIDGVQWDIKDQNARDRITALEEKQTKIIDIIFGGTTSFSGKMKYLGEDNNYEYYNFWWEAQNKIISENVNPLEVIPQNTNTDKILSLNLNILQSGNAGIIQATQHETGANGSGILTYLQNVSTETRWIISGMGILRRNK